MCGAEPTPSARSQALPLNPRSTQERIDHASLRVAAHHAREASVLDQSRGSREAEAFLARFLVGDGPRRDRDRALFLGALRKRQSDDARRRRLAPARLLLLAAA